MVDKEKQDQFIELRAKGLSYDRIAKEINVSKPTLIKWSKDFELEISNLKAIELEALQEKYFMLKANRIKLFGEKLKAIQEELDKRDLSEVPTAKLFELMIRYSDYLKNEDFVIEFKEKQNGLQLNVLNEGFVETWKG